VVFCIIYYLKGVIDEAKIVAENSQGKNFSFGVEK
jgi:hypothetical protein